MGIRAFIRDIIALYVGFRLLAAGLGSELSRNDMLVFGIVLFVFSLWFLLERIGILPKVT
ncbi:MAG TPA: hypothetical protein VJB11_03295 [archaeon]|nr:hypothetical protein [archaeon]